jgi:hypothetical protein
MTGMIQSLLDMGTLSVTGFAPLTLVLVLFLFVIVAMLFKLPFEYIIILAFPLAITFGILYPGLATIISLSILFIAILVARLWLPQG